MGVGIGVGLAVGLRICNCDGFGVVGISDGISLGIRVGCCNGRSVGESVGNIVGIMLGSCEGACVFCTGERVGYNVNCVASSSPVGDRVGNKGDVVVG